jgi:hypothetical protein
VKTYIKKGFFYLALAFVVLFFLRLGYGYLAPAGTGMPISNTYSDGRGALDFSSARKNYATDKLSFDSGQGMPAKSVDQKYEKVASLLSKTTAFDDDEKKVRDLIVKYKAQIQFEQSSGLPGSKRLNLAIGVNPAKFDSMVSELKGISSLISIEVNKTDKTNEYKDLNAKKVSLEKTRDALFGLKSKGGSINEQINLESKIREIETELQETGVSLGEYAAENEFCTIKYALDEQRAAARAHIPFLHRVRVAFAWTIKYYLMSLMVALAGALTILVTVVVLDKLNLLTATADSKEE